MKQIKLNNVIFPIWMLLFIPPVIFIALIGNFIIDSLVVIGCFYAFKLIGTEKDLKTFYKKSIFKVWILGFLADIIGAFLLFGFILIVQNVEGGYELTSAISYDPFSNLWAVIILLFAMILVSFFIFIFNYLFTFRKLIEDEKTKIKVAFTIAIVTIPWTFLLPTKWFY